MVHKTKNKNIFKILKYNDKNIYFQELPMGVSGVIHNNTAYIYDKDSLTKCGGIHDSVFEVKGPDQYFSKCFISENIIKHVFEGATPYLGNINFNFPITIYHY